MILLKNGTYIDWRSLEFLETDILVGEGDGATLTFLKKHDDLQDAEVIDCRGKFITKSFANGHHHAYSALATGMPQPAEAPGNFHEILQKVWWRLDKALDADIIRSCALVTAIGCARNGVTFVIDHHASPNAIPGSLEIIAEAFDRIGIGHLLCYEISDRDGPDKAAQGLESTADYLHKHQGLVGLHALFTVCEETMKRAVILAMKTNSGIHIHTAEDRVDQEECMQKYGMRVIERLKNHGIPDLPKTILAHCLHLSDREREIISSSKAWVVENMESNLNNGVGFFRSKGIGSRIFLGTDGMHSDMMKSTKAAYFGAKHIDTPDPAIAYSRLRNVHHYLETNRFAGDGDNNLVIFNYDPPTPFATENFSGHFFFGMDSSHISEVISKGRLIFSGGKILTVDEEEILKESRKQAGRLWERMK